MKKKFTYIIFIIFILIFILVQKSIGDNFSYLQQVKYIMPKNVKIWLKENVFVHKSYKILKRENEELKQNMQLNQKKNSKIREKIFELSDSDEFLESSIIEAQDNVAKNYKFIRNNILKNYILPKKITKFFDEGKNIPKGYWINKPEGEFNVYKLNYYNMSHIGILEKENGNRKIIIYNQGHDNNPYNHSYFIELKNYYKGKGYDVFSLSMTNLGYNLNVSNKKDKINFPGLKNPIVHLSHNDYKYYHDPNFPNIKGLSLMLSGNYYLIKEIIKNYDEVVMVGISGGGWYTTILPSIITEIKNSYSFSGSFPFLLRTFGSFGDWEQWESEIYNEYNYLDFYFLNITDKDGNFTRYHNQIYIRNDDTFNDPGANLFKKIKNRTLTSKNFQINLLNSDKHEIDVELLKKILK